MTITLIENTNDDVIPVNLENVDNNTLIKLVQQERVNFYADAIKTISDKDRISLLNSIGDTALKQVRIDADKEIAGSGITAKDIFNLMDQIGKPFYSADNSAAIPSSPDLPAFTPVDGELSSEQNDIQLEELIHK